MPMMGYRGISFPFRIGVKGGVVMSSTSQRDPTHIIEGMKQLLLTRHLERVMESHVYSNIDATIFEPNDISLRTLLAHEVVEALKLDKRIEVTEGDVVVTSADNRVYAEIKFKVRSYNTYYSTSIEVGEING
jgi:phage baseplate assembly protein W